MVSTVFMKDSAPVARYACIARQLKSYNRQKGAKVTSYHEVVTNLLKIYATDDAFDENDADVMHFTPPNKLTTEYAEPLCNKTPWFGGDMKNMYLMELISRHY